MTPGQPESQPAPEPTADATRHTLAFEVRGRKSAPGSDQSGEATTAKGLLEEQLPLIQKLLASAGRRYSLSPQDRDDFQSYAFVKLVDNDYRILRRYQGRSSLRSYLRVVVVHLALDYLDHRFGKWRPSAAARRLGDAAKILETLLYRDGLSEDEAVSYLKINHLRPETRRELHALASSLQPRTKRGEDITDDFEWLAVEPVAEHRADGDYRRRQAAQLQYSVQQAVDQLDLETRQILAWRYRDGLTARAIAERIERSQRSIYTQVDRAVRQLRRCLTASQSVKEQFRSLAEEERSHLLLYLTVEPRHAESDRS